MVCCPMRLAEADPTLVRFLVLAAEAKAKPFLEVRTEGHTSPVRAESAVLAALVILLFARQAIADPLGRRGPAPRCRRAGPLTTTTDVARLAKVAVDCCNRRQ